MICTDMKEEQWTVSLTMESVPATDAVKTLWGGVVKNMQSSLYVMAVHKKMHMHKHIIVINDNIKMFKTKTLT